MIANQNDLDAQTKLGNIYYEGKYISRDINKAIYYYSFASNQNFPDAQLKLGNIYYEGKYISQDINKAKKYFALISKQNIPVIQFYIGKFCLNENKNINKAIYHLYLAAQEHFTEAEFLLGIIYSKGEKIQKNMDKSIYYYKNASSMNHSKAKNNLAMIYAHKIVVEKNEQYVKQYAIVLLKESIDLNNQVSMYNLAHFYFFDENETENINTIIDYLIKSSNQVISSIALLSLILIKKLKIITYNSIENKLKTINCGKIKKLANDIFIYIEKNNLKDPKNYDNLYRQLKNEDYVYDWDYKIVSTSSFFAEKKVKIPKTCKNIDKSFYDGFGIILT